MTRVDELIRELAEHGVYIGPKKVGRPAVWKKTAGVERIMHVWLTVELQRHIRKKSVRATINALFNKAPWLVDVGDKGEQLIPSAERARRIYYAAKDLMQRDSKRCERWTRNLALAKQFDRRQGLRERAAATAVN